MSRRIAGIGMALAGATVLAAVSVVTLGMTMPKSEAVAAAQSSSAAQGGSSQSAYPIEADYCFVEAMIPHHEQALELSGLVLSATGTRERTLALAAFIERDQTTEIGTMRQWQDAWARAVPAGDAAASAHSSHEVGAGTAPAPDDSIATGCGEHADHTTMKGMATPGQLETLASLATTDGVAADRMFLELMIVHHEGALEMATLAVIEGSNAFVRTTAKHVLVEQAREIAAMRTLLDEVTGAGG